MDPLPFAVESEALREASARAHADLRRHRALPAVWTTRILVLVVGAPVALLGVSAGLLMDRQDRNSGGAALAALEYRIEQRIVECIRRTDEPLPERAVYLVENDAADAEAVRCGDGACPALSCVRSRAGGLVRQAPLGFSSQVELDFTVDRTLEASVLAQALEAELAHVVLAVSVDGAHFTLSCTGDEGESKRVPATFRAARDLAALRAALPAVQASCRR